MNGAKYFDGSMMRHDYIASEFVDNINAALETVTVALTYMTCHLGRDLEWKIKIRHELPTLSEDADGYASFASIDTMPILDSFVRESQGLWSS